MRSGTSKAKRSAPSPVTEISRSVASGPRRSASADIGGPAADGEGDQSRAVDHVASTRSRGRDRRNRSRGRHGRRTRRSPFPAGSCPSQAASAAMLREITSSSGETAARRGLQRRAQRPPGPVGQRLVGQRQLHGLAGRRALQRRLLEVDADGEAMLPQPAGDARARPRRPDRTPPSWRGCRRRASPPNSSSSLRRRCDAVCMPFTSHSTRRHRVH